LTWQSSLSHPTMKRPWSWAARGGSLPQNGQGAVGRRPTKWSCGVRPDRPAGQIGPSLETASCDGRF